MVVALLLLGACGGNDDEGQIDSLVRSYVSAFAAQDAEKFASYLSSNCQLDPGQLQAAFAAFAGRDISVEIQSVDVTDLTDSSATATAIGIATVSGRSLPLSGLGDQINRFSVVKENGEWRIGNCPDASIVAPPSG